MSGGAKEPKGDVTKRLTKFNEAKNDARDAKANKDFLGNWYASKAKDHFFVQEFQNYRNQKGMHWHEVITFCEKFSREEFVEVFLKAVASQLMSAKNIEAPTNLVCWLGMGQK